MVARCEYYRALWTKDWKESKSVTLEIEDCAYDSFMALLKHIYAGIIELTGENAMDLLALSDRYQLFQLKTACASFISSGIEEENVFDLLIAAETFSAGRMKSNVFRFLFHHQKLLKSKEFGSLPIGLKKEIKEWFEKLK